MSKITEYTTLTNLFGKFKVSCSHRGRMCVFIGDECTNMYEHLYCTMIRKNDKIFLLHVVYI